MPVTIHIPRALRRFCDAREAVEVEGRSAGEAFEDLFRQYPDLRVRILDARGAVHPYFLLACDEKELARDGLAGIALEGGEHLDLLTIVGGGKGDREHSDVRMRGFRDRTTVARALETALAGLAPTTEEVGVSECAGRVLAEDVVSSVDVPPFDRSAMDGYAVCAESTFGASLYDPIALRLVGESLPGRPAAEVVDPTSTCRIMTGARMPEGADAVLKAEEAEERDGLVHARGAVAPGKNVGKRGEDVRAGEAVLNAGRRLRAQDAGLLASIGHHPVRVVKRPTVGILVSGDELLAPGSKPEGSRIVDSNTPMLRALVARDGGEVTCTWALPDDREVLREALASARVDVLVTAGGSSVGREDWLPVLVDELGDLPVHGVAMRPSAPTGIGSLGGTRVLLLPGNPVSCLCAYDFFAGPVIRALGGRAPGWPHRRVTARLSRRIASQVGRVDYARVALAEDGSAAPIALAGASILSSTTRADGFVIVPEESEGLAEGEVATVRLYDAECP